MIVRMCGRCQEEIDKARKETQEAKEQLAALQEFVDKINGEKKETMQSNDDIPK